MNNTPLVDIISDWRFTILTYPAFCGLLVGLIHVSTLDSGGVTPAFLTLKELSLLMTLGALVWLPIALAWAGLSKAFKRLPSPFSRLHYANMSVLISAGTAAASAQVLWLTLSITGLTDLASPGLAVCGLYLATIGIASALFLRKLTTGPIFKGAKETVIFFQDLCVQDSWNFTPSVNQHESAREFMFRALRDSATYFLGLLSVMMILAPIITAVPVALVGNLIMPNIYGPHTFWILWGAISAYGVSATVVYILWHIGTDMDEEDNRDHTFLVDDLLREISDGI